MARLIYEHESVCPLISHHLIVLAGVNICCYFWLYCNLTLARRDAVEYSTHTSTATLVRMAWHGMAGPGWRVATVPDCLIICTVLHLNGQPEQSASARVAWKVPFENCLTLVRVQQCLLRSATEFNS